MNFYNFTIFRYLFLDILKPFFIISLVLTGIVWLSRSLNYIELIINKGLSLPVYFWFVSLIAPKILSILLPLISFASISYTYYRLRADSEIIAMECAGISKSILMLPALFFGICIAILVFLIEAHISPKNYKTFKSFQSDLRNNFVISSLQEGEFHSLYPNITVYIDKIFKDGKLSNLLIHDTRNKGLESTIIAKEGKISNLSEQPHIIVYEGSRFLYNKNNLQTNIMNFDKYEFEINIEKQSTNIRFKQVEERSLKELFFENKITNQKILNEFLAEGHRRISSPFLVIFMSMTAACCILLGSSKHANTTRRISFFSAVIVAIQAVYIVVINSINFSLTNIFLFYFILVLMIALPVILIKYEKKLFKSLNFI
ncbi:MAG: hypothetical protein CFH34_00666 [Alphaproteobacteria bacterium MarineAlpha9_Bin4]|nr:hypothetical protein [Pelagibacterales bacterium]PPR26849.1 MAG: hypothetical protein CFH34_00666 [Alphaproteobacteria bacterium MarineAlpha9_Bin4]